MQAMEISRSALDVEWRRIEVISQNLANMNSARVGNGQAYQAQTLVSGPRGAFASYLDPKDRGANPDLQSLGGVAIYGIQSDHTAPRLVHEPGNPQADKAGMVAYPNIDQAAQMTLMIKTTRAYEANIVMMNIARQMYGKALELGGR